MAILYKEKERLSLSGDPTIKPTIKMKKTRGYSGGFAIACSAAVLAVTAAGTAGCKTHLNSGRNNPGDDKTYHIRFEPSTGSAYHYDLTDESNLRVKVEDKDVETRRKSEIGVNYRISRDSNDLVLEINYDKIHIYTKNGDAVTELDADDASSSTFNAGSQLLSGLKGAKIVARVSPGGTIRSVSGYQEVINKVLETDYGQEADKAKTRLMWQQLVEQGILKKNMDQLIRAFPDSALHIGDRWKINSTEKEDIPFNLENVYQLVSIDDGIATIRSEGQLSGDSSASMLMGYTVTSDLKGTEEGTYQVDIRTGMPVSAEVTAKVAGAVQLAGRDAEIKMETTAKLSGKIIK